MGAPVCHISSPTSKGLCLCHNRSACICFLAKSSCGRWHLDGAGSDSAHGERGSRSCQGIQACFWASADPQEPHPPFPWWHPWQLQLPLGPAPWDPALGSPCWGPQSQYRHFCGTSHIQHASGTSGVPAALRGSVCSPGLPGGLLSHHPRLHYVYRCHSPDGLSGVKALRADGTGLTGGGRCMVAGESATESVAGSEDKDNSDGVGWHGRCTSPCPCATHSVGAFPVPSGAWLLCPSRRPH